VTIYSGKKLEQVPTKISILQAQEHVLDRALREGKVGDQQKYIRSEDWNGTLVWACLKVAMGGLDTERKEGT